MAFAETPKAEQGKQPFKYNGKELDQMHGLNLYDYSARYYEPALGRFSTVDPLAEKHYNLSPYMYCMNNPIKFIDPLGMDTVNIDHEGHMVYPKGGESDIVNVTNKKGKTMSRTYKLGTLKEGAQKNKKGTEDPEYAYLSIDTEENSKDIFEFLADNTTVEWSNSMYKKGNSISNYIEQDIVTTEREWRTIPFN